MDIAAEDWELVQRRGVVRGILVHLLLRGDDLPSNIARYTGHHPRSISADLGDVKERGICVPKGNGVWTLSPYGSRLAARVVEEYDLEECHAD